MKYNNLLTLVKKLNQLQQKAEKSALAYMEASQASRAKRANLSDKSVIDAWERGKSYDLVHCELVNLGMSEPLPEHEYDSREITHSAGFGHDYKFMYHPPKPDCMK